VSGDGRESNPRPALADCALARLFSLLSRSAADRETGEPMSRNATAQTGRFVSVSTAANYLSANQRTVRNMILDGRLPARTLGPRVLRIRLSDIDAALKPYGGFAGELATTNDSRDHHRPVQRSKRRLQPHSQTHRGHRFRIPQPWQPTTPSTLGLHSPITAGATQDHTTTLLPSR
jgi:excisionase family DNA binding protein